LWEINVKPTGATVLEEVKSFAMENSKLKMIASQTSGGMEARNASDSKSDLQGHSRSLAVIPFDKSRMISY